MTGIYIHFPFCSGKCGYCDFYSRSDLSSIPAYLAALENQIESLSALETDSIYLGGGTPSLLSGSQMGGLFDALMKKISPSAGCEITVEVNPASCGFETLLAYRRAGVNRLSVGVQTACDATLKTLLRPHTAKDSRLVLEEAIKAGFDNISADLMLALPGEDTSHIRASIALLAQCGVSHISSYLLKISEGTAFGRSLPESLPDEDSAADLYLFAVSELCDSGYEQYEISNFAKPGFESRHNLKYWNCEDYIGLGPGAHSSVGAGRYSFPPDLPAYLERFKEPPDSFLSPLREEGAVDSDDYVMLRLRTNEGLSLNAMKKRFGFAFSEEAESRIARYEESGLLRLEKDCLRLTTRGMLVSNSIIAGLLAASGAP